MTNKKLRFVLAFVAASAAGAGYAQGIRPSYEFPGTAPTGGVQVAGSPLYFSPFVGLAVGRDDNVLLTEDNKRTSTLYVFSPGFKLDARSPSSVFQMDYQVQIGRYSSSEDDNYIDHVARAQLDTAFSERSFLRAGYKHVRGHDPRGSTDRALTNEPDKFRLSQPSLTYAYGAMGAQGRFEAYASEARLTYLNNRETTAVADRKSFEFGGAFYWRVAPKTYALVEARQTNISFKVPSDFSGDERRYYGGVSWEATAATTGTIKVGRLTRRFNGDIAEKSTSSWEAAIRWAPRTYSVFDFYSQRQTSESTGVGTFILSSAHGVNWNHAWSSFVTTGVNLRFQRDELQGTDRTDDIRSLGLKVGYRMRRWLTLGAEYNHVQRDSNVPGIDYDKNIYLLTATASM